MLTNPKIAHGTDRLQQPVGLDGKLEDLPFAIASADARPTRQAAEVFEKHRTRADATLSRLDTFVTGEIAALSQRILDTGVQWVDTSVK